MGNHYGSDYNETIAVAGETSLKRWRWLHEFLRQYKSSGDLLDLGCSTGSFLASLKDQPWRLHGIEMSEPAARRAEAASGALIFVGDVPTAPFLPESFDAITCFHVLEHLYRPREIIMKVWEWLKPGGIFFVIVPNIDSAGARLFKSYWYGLELPRHLFHFSPNSLKTLAQSVGLQEMSLTTHRVPFIEDSTRYIGDMVLRKIGVSRAPFASARRPSLLWKVVRKMFRLTVLPPLEGLISLAGDGEIIHAIFRKEASGSQSTQG